jgi:hypothetical protein
VQHLLELRRVALVARVGLAQAVDGEAAQLLEAGRVLLLERAAALEEAGKVLRRALAGALGGGEAVPTRALAMLALRRLRSVETPTSECSTSCTRCCVCAGDVGAAASMGEGRPPSSALKSGLKLSALSMGGMAGGAAIAGAVVVVVVVVMFAPACHGARRTLGRHGAWGPGRLLQLTAHAALHG